MSWRGEREYWDAERKYYLTKNIKYAAFALGRWRASMSYPADPPEWALDACVVLWDAATARMAPVIARTSGGSPYPDDEPRVRWVAAQRGTAGEKRTPRQLFAQRLRDEGITDPVAVKSHVQRLLNYYGPEHLTEEDPNNHHISRAAALRARERWYNALKEPPENGKE